jgi:predicted dithiol-disulfide oxidoreductase (DUF899 family)
VRDLNETGDGRLLGHKGVRLTGLARTDIGREQRVALEDGAVYHTYSVYARGLDGLWGMCQWLNRAPRGRNEARGPGDPLNWFRRHDDYHHANQAGNIPGPG